MDNWRKWALYGLAFLWLAQLFYHAVQYDFTDYHSKLHARCERASEPFVDEFSETFYYGKPALLVLKTSARILGSYDPDKTGFYTLVNVLSVVFALASIALLLLWFTKIDSIENAWWLFLMLNLLPFSSAILAYRLEESFTLLCFMTLLTALLWFQKKHKFIYVVLVSISLMMLSAQVPWGVFTFLLPFIFWLIYPDTNQWKLVIPAVIIGWGLQWLYFPELIDNLPGRQGEFLAKPFGAFSGAIKFEGEIYHGVGLPIHYTISQWISALPVAVLLLFLTGIVVYFSQKLEGRRKLALVLVASFFTLIVGSLANGAASNSYGTQLPSMLFAVLFAALTADWLFKQLPHIRGFALVAVVLVLGLSFSEVKALITQPSLQYNHRNFLHDAGKQAAANENLDYEYVLAYQLLDNALQSEIDTIHTNLYPVFPGHSARLVHQSFDELAFSRWKLGIYQNDLFSAKAIHNNVLRTYAMKDSAASNEQLLAATITPNPVFQGLQDYWKHFNNEYIHIKSVEQLQRELPALLEGPLSYQAAYMKAKLAYHAGELDDAEQYAQQCLQTFPDHQRALLLMVDIEMERRKHKVAVELLQEMKMAYPTVREEANWKMALMLARNANWTKAFNWADSVESKDGKLKNQAFRLKRYLKEQMQNKLPLTTPYKKQLDDMEASGDLQVQAYVFMSLEDNIEDYFADYPQLPSTAILLARIYVHGAKYEKAVEVLEQCLYANPTNAILRNKLDELYTTLIVQAKGEEISYRVDKYTAKINYLNL